MGEQFNPSRCFHCDVQIPTVGPNTLPICEACAELPVEDLWLDVGEEFEDDGDDEEDD